MVFLDTHAAVFLWEGRLEVFGDAARAALEREPLGLSPFVRLELAWLAEIGRLLVEPDAIVGGLEADCGVHLADDRTAAVVGQAMRLVWTRDPFDRLIVATAMLHGARLVTRDRRIQEHFDGAIW
jgi:PIN domain nuclease of toxin-antitoxin system